MTVSSADSIAGPYDGDGSQVAFDFAFKVFVTSDVLVVLTDTAGVDDESLVLDVDYTVALNGDQDANPGGTVTMTTAPATGELLTLLSQIPELQAIALQNQGGMYPKVVERGFDKATRLIQQLSEKLTRAVLQPVGTAISNLRYPTPVAGEILGWDQSGTGLANYSASDLTSIAAFANWSYENKSGDGTTTAFTLAASPGALANMAVAISGITLRPELDYTLSGTTLTFVSPPALGTNNISIRYGQAVPSTDLPSPGSNRNALMSDGANWSSRAVVIADVSDIAAVGATFLAAATAALQRAALGITAAGDAIATAANAAAQRTALGLGSLATQSSVTAAQLPNGAGVAYAIDVDATRTDVSSGSITPFGIDGSTPLITEGGDTGLSLTHSASSTTNKLLVTLNLCCDFPAVNTGAVALFAGSTCIASCSVASIYASMNGTITLVAEHIPGSTSPVVYTARVSTASGTVFVNQATTGNNLGTMHASTITILEIKA